jgi:hypothetical protein
MGEPISDRGDFRLASRLQFGWNQSRRRICDRDEVAAETSSLRHYRNSMMTHHSQYGTLESPGRMKYVQQAATPFGLDPDTSYDFVEIINNGVARSSIRYF